MITSTQLTGSSISVPSKVFTASTTGAPIGGSVTGQRTAITTMVLCNTGTPDITDESVDTCAVNIHLVKSGDTADTDNLIVSNLTVPAGETVFFSDEKIVLDAADEVWIGTSAASLITATISSLEV
jgi:hypothetical protein